MIFVRAFIFLLYHRKGVRWLADKEERPNRLRH
jgi:hypothetical protein